MASLKDNYLPNGNATGLTTAAYHVKNNATHIGQGCGEYMAVSRITHKHTCTNILGYMCLDILYL